MPYCDTEDFCYICKEKLRIEREKNVQSIAQMIKDPGAQGLKVSTGLNTDENSYFVNTKRIRISVRVAQRLEI